MSEIPPAVPPPAPGAEDADELDAIVGAVLVSSRVLVAVSARSLADVEDSLTLTQFRALVVLSGLRETRLSALAERLGVGPSSALRTVDRLLAAGLVTRQEDARDRRAVVLALTERGREVVDTVTDRRRAAIAEVVRRMPAERRTGLVAALTAFAEAAHEPLPDPAREPADSW
ncbi:MarR family transcriptional regulator [Phycicoccus sp. MAQZ13P-2]|uniref:MarR family winged helix-turn-helix transcriptional regulator n=1 Tax=Phycicoccus mangrovi TaxID=2840470 RepID=UPI001BFFE2E5|nr:MarR family transcriptional regulator [Phycicoccus mangrovi]MBT9255353.1 MarR family transcriptional regulator [Phycicoccus mangrovi]MBT9273566.1 MarR family transcriptional regulator [Phycicoccus mangrovi]